MSKNNKRQSNKKKPFKKRFKEMLNSKKTTKILVLILAIPVALFGFNILRAELGKSKPVIADRFEGDHDPAITDENIAAIEKAIADEKFKDTEVILKVSTMRVYIEVDDNTDKDTMKAIADDIYGKVNEVLPVEKYFSIINNKQKQYDLEIHIYNDMDEEKEENFKYYLLKKSSSMETAKGQMLSDPKDPEFAESVKEYAEQLKQEKENPDKDNNDE